jgi:neutral ceramidase
MFEIGAAKRDITAFKKGIGMMGYGMPFNTVEDIETPLYARAYFFRHVESGKQAVLVVAEMCFVTSSVKSGVMKRLTRRHPELGLTEENVLLSAQHTHSGPGGYSHYGFYNITIPGFVPAVYQQIVEGIANAIVAAAACARPAQLRLSSAAFPADVPVAFNRSMRPFLANPEAKGISSDQPQLAIDREMTLLRIDGLDGEAIGAVNWFGVHTTSVHNDNHSVCWDNKGYAADMMERALRDQPQAEDFIGAFAQGPAGDVTPNHVWDSKKKWTRGPFPDDFESARHNGRLQWQQAQKIYAQAGAEGHVVRGGIDYGLLHVDFTHVACDPAFAFGKTDARSDLACHGLAFLKGTREGPGMPKPIAIISTFLAGIVKAYELSTNFLRKAPRRLAIQRKYRLQGKKVIMIEAGERRVLGSSNIKKLIVPSAADASIRNFKVLHPEGWKESKPWTPHVLPLQLLILGDLAIVAVPAEPTTIAARRIRTVVAATLAERGIHQVIIAPYANAYCGYITTYEEYQHQHYEGGHTVFGQWTLAAFLTKYQQLAQQMAQKAETRELLHDAEPPEFSAEELQRRTYTTTSSL